jgi:hypothetical protein
MSVGPLISAARNWNQNNSVQWCITDQQLTLTKGSSFLMYVCLFLVIWTYSSCIFSYLSYLLLLHCLCYYWGLPTDCFKLLNNGSLMTNDAHELVSVSWCITSVSGLWQLIVGINIVTPILFLFNPCKCGSDPRTPLHISSSRVHPSFSSSVNHLTVIKILTMNYPGGIGTACANGKIGGKVF